MQWQAMQLLQRPRRLALHVLPMVDDEAVQRIVKVQILDWTRGRSAPGSWEAAEPQFLQAAQPGVAFLFPSKARSLTRWTSQKVYSPRAVC